MAAGTLTPSLLPSVTSHSAVLLQHWPERDVPNSAASWRAGPASAPHTTHRGQALPQRRPADSFHRDQMPPEWSIRRDRDADHATWVPRGNQAMVVLNRPPWRPALQVIARRASHARSGFLPAACGIVVAAPAPPAAVATSACIHRAVHPDVKPGAGRLEEHSASAVPVPGEPVS
jgi:hypothetical protein